MTDSESAPEVVSPDGSMPFGSAPTTPAGGGCGRAGVIGCGVLTLALGIAAVLFLLKAGDLFSWALSRFEEEIVRALPEDCTDAERQRLEKAFVAAAAAVRSGEFDPLALRRLQRKLADSILDEDQKLTREQLRELTVALEEVAGYEAEPEPSEEQEGAPSAIAA